MAANAQYLNWNSTAAQAANTSTSIPKSAVTADYAAQRQLDQKVNAAETKVISSEK